MPGRGYYRSLTQGPPTMPQSDRKKISVKGMPNLFHGFLKNNFYYILFSFHFPPTQRRRNQIPIEKWWRLSPEFLIEKANKACRMGWKPPQAIMFSFSSSEMAPTLPTATNLSSFVHLSISVSQSPSAGFILSLYSFVSPVSLSLSKINSWKTA